MPLEIDGMLGGVIELVAMTAVDTPALKALNARVSLLNEKIQDEAVYIKERPLAGQALDRFDYKIETANINSSILTDVER